MLADNGRSIVVDGSQIVIARGAAASNVNGYLPAATFANLVEQAVTRSFPYWQTGFMVYDFATDEEEKFDYSLTVIPAFHPTPQPTTSTTASSPVCIADNVPMLS